MTERVEVSLRLRAVATVTDAEALRLRLQEHLDAVTGPLLALGDAVEWHQDNEYRADVMRGEG